MRFRLADPASSNYMGVERFLNNIKLIPVNSALELVLGVGLVDADGNQIVPQGVSNSVGDGRQTVTTAGTRVQLSASSVPCKKVTICAETDNTDFIVVGGATVVAALATRRGIPLNPGDTITLEVSNLNLVYLDSLVSTEGCSFLFEV